MLSIIKSRNFFTRGKIKEKKIGAIVLGAFLLFFIDRFLKSWALANLYNQKITIIKKWFYFDLYKNENIAFSLPLPKVILIPIIIIIISLLVYYLFTQIKKKFSITEISLIFIIIGAISNLIDRFQYGYVVDYINIWFWPVFNIADIMISGGTIILITILFKNRANKSSS